MYFRDGSMAGILAARLAGIKTIIGSRRNQGYWLTKKELQLQSFLNRFVTVIVANSQSTKAWAIKTELLKEEHIKVIHNGIDLEHFQLIDQKSKER